MKILTFQHKKVLEEIQNKGVYIANANSEYRNATPKCYDKVFTAIRNKEKNSTIPIFGWYAVLNSNNDKLKVDAATVFRCMEMTSQDEDNYILFELEMEEDKVSLQDFYNFVDARCEEERIDPYYEKFENFPFEVVFKIEKDCEIQCTMSSIKKENIKNIYSYKKLNGKYIITLLS